MGDHLIGLECGHFRPADGFTDAEAAAFFAMMIATGDVARCGGCIAHRRVTGPVVRIVATA